METLRSTAPGLLGNFGIPPPPTGFTTASAASTTNSSTTTNTTTNTTTSTTNSAQANPVKRNSFIQRREMTFNCDSNNKYFFLFLCQALFSEFMARMMNGMSSSSNPSAPPEERYASQLDTLTSMGFANREANLQGKQIGRRFNLTEMNSKKLNQFIVISFQTALIATFGDINAAVERLLALNQLSLS